VTVTVHHLGISQSDRIVWLCEELGIAYELKRYDRDPQTRMAPADYKALTPFGTAPVIDDGDVRLGETGAIVEWLIERHGGAWLVPAKDAANRADYLFWFHFAQGSLMPAAMADMLFAMLGGDGSLSSLRERIERAYAMIEERLGTVEWIAGDAFTAADIVLVFPLTTMRMFGPRDLSGYPNILAYLQRVGARPAFRRAMAKADPGFEVPLT
jgi:glutathione S-transferase